MGVLSQEPAGGSFISDPYQGMKKGIKRIISVPHGQYLRQLSGEPVSGKRMDTPKPRDLRQKPTQ